MLNCVIDQIKVVENEFIELKNRLKSLEHENIANLSEKEVYKKAFQENLKLMRNLLDNAGFGSILFDNTGNIVRVNEKICSLTNYSSDELLQQKITNLFQAQNELNHFLTHNDQSLRAEVLIERKDGTSFISKCIFSPNLNLYGKTTGYYLLVEDITDFKKDEEKLKVEKTYFKHLFDDSPEALAIIDREGKITNINTKFTKLFLYGSEECLFCDISILLPGENYAEESNNFLKNTFKNQRQYIETIRKRKDNQLIDVSITSTPVTFDENTKLAYVMFLDISERKNAERRLNEAKVKAEESDRLKSSFLANLSHEIRTPMNAIVGFSSLITGMPTLSEEKKEKYGKNIIKSCDNLVQLIDKIIDISKIEASQLRLLNKDFLLINLLDELYDVFNTRLNETNNKDLVLLKDYSPDQSIHIFADESRLKQILYNLLDNAIKYTLRGHVKFGFVLNNDFTILFYVEDTGIGIDKPDHDKIFKRFTKIENNTNKLFSGIGIGLYISKKLIEEMGGQIYVESQIDKGSKFTFTIPLNYNEIKKGVKNSNYKKNNLKRSLDLSDKKILIVENSESSYVYIESLLSYTNAKITWLQSGKETIELFNEQKNTFDLIILDFQLPDISGYKVATAIRKANLSIPIIGQIPYSSEEYGNKSNCNILLSKPINSEIFLQALNQLLELK